MIEIFLDDGFKNCYKKFTKNNNDLKIKFYEKLTLFKDNPYNTVLKTHKLSGKLKDFSAFSIDYKTRVVFKFISNTKVLLIDIGYHDSVY